MESIASSQGPPSPDAHGRKEPSSSPLHRPDTDATASLISPSYAVEASCSPPTPVTPPRSSSLKMNPVPQAPSRKGCSSSMTAPLDAACEMPQHTVQQQKPDPEQNEIETADAEQTTACVESQVASTEEMTVLLPANSNPKNKQRSRCPSTPSCTSSSSPASSTSSRYSPASSGSRTPSSTSSTSSATSSSYEPLSHPSSSELRQRRKQREVPPVPLPTFFQDATTACIRIGDDSSENNNNANDNTNNNGNEQYHDQQHRLRHLLQQNFGKYQHKEKDDDDICVGIRSCDSSLASSSHQFQHGSDVHYSNMELQQDREQEHEQEQEQEHEIIINPKSIEGTIEAASFHLHGQTGGRVKSTNPEFPNAAVMDGYALRNLMMIMDTEESSSMMSGDALEEDTFETNVRIDLEKGRNVISSRGGRNSNSNSNYNNSNDQHDDLWSTGIAAAVVMGTAARYHKTFFMFPHGRKVILPIVIGTVALSLSIVTLRSCRFLTVLPEENNSQVFELGLWSYLSPGTVYDGEVCLPYPSDMEVDTPFMVARMVSVLATCLGGGLLLLTATMMCIPYGESSISLLGLGYILAGILQALSIVYYQTNNCKGGGGYFRGLQCKPNQDLVFCLAASVLYLACGCVLHMLQKFVVASPQTASQIYTCSAKSKSSDERKGILRTVEKSWTKIPSGETLVATVLVERRMGSNGKTKMIHSIQTEMIDQ